MEVFVLNGNPKGCKSATLQYVRYLQGIHPRHELKIIHISQHNRKIENDDRYFQSIVADIRTTQGILWATRVYDLLVPAKLQAVYRIDCREWEVDPIDWTA